MLVVFLSSCQYSPASNYEEMYYDLEKEYSKLYKELESTDYALSHVESDLIVLYEYFTSSYPEFTEKEAHDSAVELYKYLKPLYK